MKLLCKSPVSVWLSKSDTGGNSIRIPGSEWYLEASSQNSM